MGGPSLHHFPLVCRKTRLKTESVLIMFSSGFFLFFYIYFEGVDGLLKFNFAFWGFFLFASWGFFFGFVIFWGNFWGVFWEDFGGFFCYVIFCGVFGVFFVFILFWFGFFFFYLFIWG